MLDLRALRHMPTVKVAMTPFPHSIDIGASAKDAWAKMLEHEIRHLPVTEGGTLVGIVTERDLRLVLRPDVKKGGGELRRVCEADAFVVPDDTPLDLVAREMAARQIGSALVERHGKLVGILTTTDVCRLLAAALEACFAAGRGPVRQPADDESA